MAVSLCGICYLVIKVRSYRYNERQSVVNMLSASSILYCRSFLADHSCLSLSSVRQLGFPLIFKQRKKCTRPLSLSAVNASQDGSSSAVEDDKKKGLFLGPQRDASGSVVGFHLMSHSDAAEKEQVSADIEGGEKSSTRVTYNIVFVSSEAAPYSKTGG